MKRFVIIAVLACLALAGCGGTSTKSSTTKASQPDRVGTASGRTLVRRLRHGDVQDRRRLGLGLRALGRWEARRPE